MDNLKPVNFTGRRHSIDAVAIANMAANQGRRISFADRDDQFKPTSQNRRHSVMIMPQNRRMSIDPKTGRRPSRRISIFSSFPLQHSTTFSGLPLGPQPEIKMENTYKMEPGEETKFKRHIIRRETEKVEPNRGRQDEFF